MAASSLQDILATEPGLAAKIDAMTELLPGVPASQANLKTLLKYVVKTDFIEMKDIDNIMIQIVVGKRRKNKILIVSVSGLQKGPPERVDLRWLHVWSDSFECTEDGLLKALITAKQNRKRYREEGPCPDCDSPGGGAPLRKKLKAKGMPKCEECMLKAIVM